MSYIPGGAGFQPSTVVVEPGSSFLRGPFHSTYRGEITPVKPIYRAISRGYFTPFTTISSYTPTNVMCEIYFFGAGTPTRLSERRRLVGKGRAAASKGLVEVVEAFGSIASKSISRSSSLKPDG